MKRTSKAVAAAVMAAGVGLTTAGCAGQATAEKGFSVVATTPILADMATQVAGPDARVTTLIPPGKDPHSFEPSLRTVREVAHADLALANGYLLEPQNLMDTVRETAGGPVVEVADAASAQGAQLVPLVENVALDAVWLGLRTVSDAPTEISLDAVDGPGAVAAYVVSTFGTPQVLFNSADGLPDSTTLPAGAHTHVSWAFSRPGTYRLKVASPGLPAATVTVAVGTPPPAGLEVIDAGHLDVTADHAAGRMVLRDRDQDFDPARTAVVVDSRTLQQVPPDPAYRFLGHPGDETYLLPQAVLGKHIHGEVDPHLWHNVDNAIAYVEVISEQMAQADPGHGADYRRRAQDYIGKLRVLDADLESAYGALPEARRKLVTPHHGYAYLEQGYGIASAGFVTPNPAVEPSPRDVIALRRTIDNLGVPAVFVEPMEQSSAATLRETAAAAGVAVCTIYGDTLDDEVPTYIDLMRANAAEITRCLGAGAPGPD